MSKRHAGRWVKPAASLVVALGLMQLAGCDTINKTLGFDEPIDYKSDSTKPSNPLTIPPDLTQAASDPRYRAPDAGGATSYNQYQEQSKAAAAATAAGQTNSNVLPQRDDMHIVRDGDIRWLVVDHPPEQVFPKLVDFWTGQGFTLDTNNPQAGLLQTDWAENRAKINDGVLHQLIGSVFDSAFDSGYRERFRTIVERVNGHTEIYISHQQMVQKAQGTSADSDVVWVGGSEDQGLNMAMLARMMVALGNSADRARQLLAQAQVANAGPGTTLTAQSGSTSLTIDESFDRAWRRVGVGLDAGGFSVKDRNRSTGDYYINYLDTDTGLRPEDPNIFSRYLFGAKSATAPEYRLHLSSGGAQTQVTVFDKDGKQDNTPTAQRILSVLKSKMQ